MCVVSTTATFDTLEVSPLAYTARNLVVTILLESQQRKQFESLETTDQRFRTPLIIGFLHDGVVEVVEIKFTL